MSKVARFGSEVLNIRKEMPPDYRPEIDGLRAISVLAVLLYHSQLSFSGTAIIAGGFLGVDVFFTISGFVITQVILREFEQTGEFSVTNFYMKRARRLLPALFSMTALSTIFAWLILLPSQLVDFSTSALYALSFLSNFYWLDTLTVYGAESSQLKPLLHTWTLAVEEQFYIIYPVFMLLFIPRSKLTLLFTLTLFSSVSMATMLLISANDWALAFYSLPTRLWEISIGAVVAVIKSVGWAVKIPTDRADILFGLGLVLVVLPLTLATVETHHPGIVTITVTLGTSIILLTAPLTKRLKKSLINPIFEYLGLRSYSIYLWHFPVFSFYRNSYGEQPLVWTLILLLGTLFLSELSYRLIETPFRSGANKSSAKLLLFLALTFLLSLIPAAYALKTEGVKSRFPDLIEIYDRNEFDNGLLKKRSNSIRRDLARQAGAKSVIDHEQNHLWFTENINTLKILIVGNSHAKNMFIALNQNKEKFPEMEFAMYRMQIDPQERTVADLIRAKNFSAADIILVSTNFREDATRNDIKSLPNFVDKMESMGKTVVLTSNSPRFINYNSDTVFDYVLKTRKGRVSHEIINSTYLKNLDDSVLRINKRLALLADQRNLLFLDKFDFSCDAPMSVCTGITPDGFKVYFDGEHYTTEGARYFGSVIHATGWMNNVDMR